jgi:hypothetical protein
MVEQGCGARGRETNAPPMLPGGDGAPPGDTMIPRQELADSGPRLRCVVAESAARHRQNAAMARRKAPHLLKRKMRYYPLTRLLGAPSPLYLQREGKTGLPRAATKNRGGGAHPHEGPAKLRPDHSSSHEVGRYGHDFPPPGVANTHFSLAVSNVAGLAQKSRMAANRRHNDLGSSL